MVEAQQTKLIDVPIILCRHSRFNSRKARDSKIIERLGKRIAVNGYERTRAVWAIEADGHYEVFAGGTRLEAAKFVEMETIPILLYRGLSDEDVSRMSDEDNENDEYHESVPIVDVWSEYSRLYGEEDWSQQKIAEVKGVSQVMVSYRLNLYKLPEHIKDYISQGKLDEAHLTELLVLSVGLYFSNWLTTDMVRERVIRDVMGKHQGLSAGIKPTKRRVRDEAGKWKQLIDEAENRYEAFPEGDEKIGEETLNWRGIFVSALVDGAVDTLETLNKVAKRIQERRQWLLENAESEIVEALTAQKREQLYIDRRERILAKIWEGDARDGIEHVPSGFQLLLTDPPYGINYQSGRRVATPQKSKMQGDDVGASDLLQAVLAKAYDRMAENGGIYIFTGWQDEPGFRTAILNAGFKIINSLVWKKKNHGMGDLECAYAPRHERIIYALKGRPKLNKRLDDVLEDFEDVQDSDHPAEKPEDLLMALIENSTDGDAMVVDPFAGGGSSLLAALKCGRDCWGCEIDEEWVKSIQHKLVGWLEKKEEQESDGDA